MPRAESAPIERDSPPAARERPWLYTFLIAPDAVISNNRTPGTTSVDDLVQMIAHMRGVVTSMEFERVSRRRRLRTALILTCSDEDGKRQEERKSAALPVARLRKYPHTPAANCAGTDLLLLIASESFSSHCCYCLTLLIS